MSLVLLYLPLMRAIVNGWFGAQLGASGRKWVAPTLIGGTFGTAVLLAAEGFGQNSYTVLGICVAAFGYEINWALQFDELTLVMRLVVTRISFLVHIYATSYMETDPHLPRFLACLSFFTFFMLVLVTAENYFQLFVGWEGVGLCSYLLINFWYTRLQANKVSSETHFWLLCILKSLKIAQRSRNAFLKNS